MTVTLQNEIRRVGTPMYCSACHGQDSKLRYVDFDAACDRGYGNEEAVKIFFDNLVLCEDCLREGARLIDFEDTTELKAKLAQTEERLDHELRLRRQAQTYAENMEQALATRVSNGKSDPVKLDHRQKPRSVHA